MQTITAAVCQNRPGYDKQENITRACSMIAEAAANGAALVSLPEIFYYPYDLKGIRTIADTDSSTIDTLRDCAARCGVHLCTGSIARQKGNRVTNTAYLVSPSGDVLLEYSKTHLFDVDLDGMRFRESSFIMPGDSVGVAETPIGVIGLLICYDIRFPEISRMVALRGAEIVIVPAAFNMTTGPAHWDTMFRARAIENQVFILAASQARVEGSVYEVYGHSMIVDPWGRVCAEADETEKIIYSELRAEELRNTRLRLPLLAQRRPGLYQM
jgi:predicted amidohydrolase